MFLEATLSCTYLLLTCGSSIYVLYKYSYNEYSTLTTPFIFAFIGFTTLGIRPLYSLTYKLFFKSYSKYSYVHINKIRKHFFSLL